MSLGAETWPRLRGLLQSRVWRANAGREFEPSSEDDSAICDKDGSRLGLLADEAVIGGS